MTIQEIKCFMAVAETKNYTRAAENMFISQPVVSKHILRLEADLGFPLFDRSAKHSVALTSMGVMLYDCLKRCSKDFEHTISEIELIFGTSPLFFYIPEETSIPNDILLKFDHMRRMFPNVTSTFRSAVQGDFAQILEKNYFLICPKDALPATVNISYFPLSKEKNHYHLLCSRNHPAICDIAENESPDLSRFYGKPLFLHTNISSDYCNLMRMYATKAIGCSPSILRLDTTDTIMAFLMSNEGYTIVYSWCTRLESSSLFSYPLESSSDIVLAYRKDLHLTETARKFLNGLKTNHRGKKEGIPQVIS